MMSFKFTRSKHSRLKSSEMSFRAPAMLPGHPAEGRCGCLIDELQGRMRGQESGDRAYGAVDGCSCDAIVSGFEVGEVQRNV